MTTTYPSTVGATPDLAAIKKRQQATWASGDYHMIGTQILIVSELLIEAVGHGLHRRALLGGAPRPPG